MTDNEIRDKILNAFEWLEKIKGSSPSDENYINADIIQKFINCYQKEINCKKAEIERYKGVIKILESDVAKISASALGVVPVYILYELYGWKRIRLTRFIKRYIKVMQDIYEKKITTDALNEEILRQTGLRYDKQRGMWFDTKART